MKATASTTSTLLTAVSLLAVSLGVSAAEPRGFTAKGTHIPETGGMRSNQFKQQLQSNQQKAPALRSNQGKIQTSTQKKPTGQKVQGRKSYSADPQEGGQLTTQPPTSILNR
jgi:hypothetical protein